MIGGADGGNNAVKLATIYGTKRMASTLGEYRERRLQSNFGDDDVIYEYEGERGFAGSLAQNESEFVREMMGDSKAHRDAKLRILIAIHRFMPDNYIDLVVGQPISKHTDEEKAKIKSMLTGRHTITVNGKERTFEIENVEVAAEGAAVYFAEPFEEDLLRIVDVGSGTVNLATIQNGNFIDKGSDSLYFGANSTKARDVSALTNAVIASTSAMWRREDTVIVAGGIAKEVSDKLAEHYPNVRIVKPRVGNSIVHPVFANAVGYYNIARNIYGG